MDHNITLITTIAAGFGIALILGFIAERIKLPALRERVLSILPPLMELLGGVAIAGANGGRDCPTCLVAQHTPAVIANAAML